MHGVQRAPLGQNVCERGQSFRNPLSCDNLASAARELPPEGRLEQRLRPQIHGEQKRQGKHGSFPLTWGQRQRGVSHSLTQSVSRGRWKLPSPCIRRYSWINSVTAFCELTANPLFRFAKGFSLFHTLHKISGLHVVA